MTKYGEMSVEILEVLYQYFQLQNCTLLSGLHTSWEMAEHCDFRS
jgi:hypothetical protein